MAMQPEVRYINAYVSGTAAYQPEKKPQKKQSVRLPKARKQQKLVIPVDMVAVGGILAAVVLSVLLVVGLMQMNQAQQEAKAMKDYAISLQAENQKLQDTYSSGYNPEEIREIALKMGMVPVEDVPHVQIQLTAPQQVQQPTAWESFWAFMVGLFA